MAERQITASTLPVVTPPWLQNTANPTQNPGQQTSQPQSNSAAAPKSETDYLGVAGKLFGKSAINYAKPFFGVGGAATGVGGAATGGITAGGGTYVTGSGLAGSASPIHTGAATTTGGGFSGGLKGGLASAGVGILGGFLGGKLFKNEKSAMGAGTGASIGMSVAGPIGAAIGFIFGGIAGKMFGGDQKEPSALFMQGAELSKYDGGGPGFRNLQTANTSLGKVGISTVEIDNGTVSKIFDVVKKSDDTVAGLFDEDQLSRVKQSMSQFDTQKRGAKAKGDRLQGAMGDFFKDRYAMAVGGLDLDYKDTFSRLATNENMGGLISTFAQMDKDIRNNSGVFANFTNNGIDPNSINPNDIRLQKTIAAPNPKAGQQKPVASKGVFGNTIWLMQPEPKTIMVTNPKYDASLAGKYKSMQVTGGYEFTKMNQVTYTGLATYNKPEYEKKTALGQRIGKDALNHIAETYGIGSRPEMSDLKKAPSEIKSPWSGNVTNASHISSINDHNKQIKVNHEKALAAWENKVLDAYVNNHSQTQGGGAAATTTLVREGMDASGEASPARQRLFGDAAPQEVKLNRAAPQNNNATNAGLLQRGGLI